jgi:hypothetical protein
MERKFVNQQNQHAHFVVKMTRQKLAKIQHFNGDMAKQRRRYLWVEGPIQSNTNRRVDGVATFLIDAPCEHEIVDFNKKIVKCEERND